ncbi:hypothetical protein ACTXT7_016813 [Hymenolepis weldensis]
MAYLLIPRHASGYADTIIRPILSRIFFAIDSGGSKQAIRQSVASVTQGPLREIQMKVTILIKIQIRLKKQSFHLCQTGELYVEQ